MLDFGISKVLTAGEHTLAGTMLGTPGYAAPEQVRGDMTAIGPTTDVFALGAIVYEALAGKPAFDTSSIEAALYQICHEQPTPLRRLAKVTRAVEAVVERALAKRPQERFAGPAALAAALTLATRRRPARARWWTAAAGLVVVVASLAVVGLVANRPANPPPAPAAPSPVAPAQAAETTPVPAAVPPSPPTDASVRLAVTPAHAHVTLDDADIQGGELRLSPGSTTSW